jgi:hypothetical protein
VGGKVAFGRRDAVVPRLIFDLVQIQQVHALGSVGRELNGRRAGRQRIVTRRLLLVVEFFLPLNKCR